MSREAPDSPSPLLRERLRAAARDPETWCALAALGVGLWLGTEVVRAIAANLAYPYSLAVVDAYMVEASVHFARWNVLYPPPSVTFVPSGYNPLLVLTSGLLMRVAGESAAVVRAIGVVSLAASCALVYRIGRREGVPPLPALLAPAVLFVSFSRCGGYWSHAATDPLAIALALGGVYVLAYRDGVRAAAAGAALLVAAFFAKQPAIYWFPAAFAFVALRSWKRALAVGGAAIGGTLLLVGILQLATDGWYWFYAVQSFAGNVFQWTKWKRWDGWPGALHPVALLPLVPLLLGASTLALRRRGVALPGPRLPWFLAWLAAAAAAVLGYIKVGGALTNMAYYYTFSTALLAMLLGDVRRLSGERAAAPWLRAALAAAVALQVHAFRFDPRTMDPAAHRPLHDEVARLVTSGKGPVLFPSDPALGMRHGNPPHFHLGSMNTLVTHSRLMHFPEDYVTAVKERRFAYVVIKPKWAEHVKLVSAYYRRERTLDDHYGGEGGERPVRDAYHVYVPRLLPEPPPPPPVRYTPTASLRPERMW